MRMLTKMALLAATAMTPGMALAQTTTAPASSSETADTQSSVEDIVVTARKIEESLSKAPVSVSAISEAKIRTLGLNSIDDFAKQLTGISFSQAFGRSSDRPVIRGQSNVLANVHLALKPVRRILSMGFIIRAIFRVSTPLRLSVLKS